VQQAVTDFFDAYVRDDASARARLASDAQAGVTSMRFEEQRGSAATIPTTSQPKVALRASVTPHSKLVDGQTVTVKWSGYTTGKVVNILQCSGDDAELDNSAACDYSHAKILQPDPTGEGSLPLQIIASAVGTGACDATHQGCFIVVNNASNPDPSASVKVPISFAK
jgi:hypothetical protein